MNQPQNNRHILVIEEPSFSKTVILEEANYSLGRHSSNDIIIAAHKVSRHHATLLRRTDTKTNQYSYWILDGDLEGNRSRNGIFINNKKCLVHELKHGDIIKFSADIKANYKLVSNSADVAVDPPTPQENYRESNPQANNNKTLFSKETYVAPFSSFQEIDNNDVLKLSSVAELSSQAIIELDLQGNLIYTNSAANRILKDISQNQSSNPLIGDLLNLCGIHNTSLNRRISFDGNYYKQQIYYLEEYNLVRTYIDDITEQVKAESDLEEQCKQYDSIFDNSFFGVIIINCQSRAIVKANNIACQNLELTKREIINQSLTKIIFDYEQIESIFQNILIDQKDYFGSLTLKTLDGRLLDINAEIKLLDSKLGQQFCLIFTRQNENSLFLNKDLISNLPRINVFKQQTKLAIANANRNQKLLAVLAIDINNFPSIKNILSKERNIILLSSFAERLNACLRFGDTVAYSEEDKFFILMQEASTIQEVAKISQRILDSLQQPFKIGEQQLSIMSNIGISVYPQDGEDPVSLMENSTTALVRDSDLDNHGYQFYNLAMNSQNSVLLRLESFLYNALERDEFILYYQPQVNINNGSIQGIEALLRWKHPELGIVSPSSFIDLAEQTGLIVQIGHWVLKTACQQNKVWLSQGFPQLRVSVNLSPLQFQQPDIPLMVSKILQETELEPHLLELEISANTVLENLDYSYPILSQLKEVGVHISIGEFSTCHSSWKQLKSIPFDTLKINRDFVQQLENKPQDLAIISAMVALGKGMDIRVVAEGVETQQQIELLKSQECEQMQGFWFSRPLAAEEATKLIPLDYSE